MASSSFYSGSSQDATNVNAVEDSKNAAALSEAAAAASAAASATSASSASGSASTATTKASESAASATASATSASASQASRVASEAAKVAAETAKTATETARDAAIASEVASGAAEVAAETAETNAAASEAAALSSKNAAATSATTASTKATESATSATASEASNVASGVAKVAAETAEANAETAQTASETAKTASEAAKVAAETAETNASTSAATATTQAGIATTKAGEAAASATSAASSATASEAAKDAALAALDSFDDRYLGAKASDPTVDNDGNALVSGALYFNTTDDTMKVYEGSQWVAAYASLSGALLAANNLSDLASASAGRTNLGLGTAATTASTDYATAAQGALAASATQPGDLATVATSGAYSDLSGTPSPFDPSTLATVATSGAYSDLSGTPTLGTAASTASTDYATAAQGTLAASATQPGDLATVATSGAYGDLSGTPTLGTAATSAATDFVAVTGDSMTGNLSFGDNDKAIFGAGSDLQIYHSGSHSYIQDVGQGNLTITAANFYLNNGADTENMISAVNDGAVSIAYNGATKLATTSTGIDVTGNATFADNGKAIFGAGSDLQVYHNSANNKSYIEESGTGNLVIRGSDIDILAGNGEAAINVAQDGAVTLYHDNAAKLATASNGITITGDATATNFNTTSDQTLKTNVETLTGSLDAVKSLRGVSFDWIENGNSEVGVIAQEVEAVLPDVVSTNDQGIKSVKYSNMVALLIEAMKEQQAQIDALTAKLNG